MQKDFGDQKLSSLFKKITSTHHICGQALFIVFILKMVLIKISFLCFLELIIITVLYILQLKTLRELFYSYWTFTALLILYFAGSFIFYIFIDQFLISSLYFFCLCLYAISSYLISSPVFYPRVNWWEYDFRYRGELKIKYDFEDESHLGRLSDLRRKAGSLISFHEIPIGQSVIISTKFTKETTYKIKIISKREELSGRGIIYGFIFELENQKALKEYILLHRIWKNRRLAKKRQKFKDVEFKRS